VVSEVIAILINRIKMAFDFVIIWLFLSRHFHSFTSNCKVQRLWDMKYPNRLYTESHMRFYQDGELRFSKMFKNASLLINFNFISLCYYYYYCSTGVITQGLMLGMYSFYYLIHSTGPYFVIFQKWATYVSKMCTYVIYLLLFSLIHKHIFNVSFNS
jgi:hypothetical protein